CERYLDLLSSRVPATVSFAMKALVEGYKAGGLDASKAVDRLAPALEGRDKGTVGRALALGPKSARGSDAPDTGRVQARARRALGHESPEIQSAALELAGGDAVLIAPYLATLAPSVRACLGAPEPATVFMDTPAASAAAQTGLRVAPVASLNELVETF